jgi:hypothetical protein
VTKPVVFVLAIGLAACSSGKSKEAAPIPPTQVAGRLVLVREAKLSTLLAGGPAHLEASGVALRDGSLYVVFDDTTRLGILDPALGAGRLTSGSDVDSQYEGVTAASGAGPGLYVVIETDASGSAAVVPFDSAAAPAPTETTDVAFAGANKGLEGLAWASVDGAEILLGLCEGNFCTNDATSTGNGRIKVLAKRGGAWVTETTLSLPPRAAFADYSDLALRPRDDGDLDVAVLSQQSSALWLGVFTTHPLGFSGPGVVYDFPRSGDGSVQYCSLEGVTFLDQKTLAMVSDKTDGEGACGDKDESAHVFLLP